MLIPNMEPYSNEKPLKLLAHIYASQKASREMSGGILHYAATHPDIELQFYGEGAPRSRASEFLDWHPDGLIIGSADDETCRTIAQLGCRAAVFVNASATTALPFRHASIYCDNRAVSESAAGLFTAKQIRSFAFIGSIANEEWSRERERFFREACRRAGGNFFSFSSPQEAKANHPHELSAIAEFLESLPKPCGIFAANDTRAKDVLDACRSAALSIPEQFIILGVDNEEFICRQTVPTLSSIVPDFERGGYLAAELLVELLRSRRRTLPDRLFRVKGIIERTSTSDPIGKIRMVYKAKEFIRDYATTDISVKSVAKASGASLRLLQKNFKEIAGTTIIEAIQTERLRRVCAMLRETATPINHIGEMCGFENENYLKKVFRARFGCTMREWRNAVEANPTCL